MTDEAVIYRPDGTPLKLALLAENDLPSGRRAIIRDHSRATNARDPGRIRVVQWEISGPIGNSLQSLAGGLATDFTQNLDTRFLRRLVPVGKRTRIVLTGDDPDASATQPLFDGFKFDTVKFGGRASQGSDRNAKFMDEQGGYLFVHRGNLSTQIAFGDWSVVETVAHEAAVQGAESWFGKGRIGLGASVAMQTRTAVTSSGSTYEDTEDGNTDPVYALAIRAGSDRCWFIVGDQTGVLQNLVSYTLDDFVTTAAPFPVGDRKVAANGIGSLGQFTFFGTETGLFSFTDKGKKAPISRALVGHRSANNGAQWAEPGWLWAYAMSDIGLRAVTSHVDNAVGIGERLREFTGHNGRVTALWQERGELWVAYLTTDGDTYIYRCTFGPETGDTGQPLMYPFHYIPDTEVHVIFSSNTPADTVVVWGEGQNIAYETIDRTGRDDLFPNRRYSQDGGTWYGTTLDADPHMLKAVRLARVWPVGMTEGDSWQIAWSLDDGAYVDHGSAITANGHQVARPVDDEEPQQNLAGHQLKPRLELVAAGFGSDVTPPELRGVLEVEYDERPDYIDEVLLQVNLTGTGVSKARTLEALNELQGSSTIGPVKVRLPDETRDKWAMVANVGRQQDFKGNGVESVEVLLHIWETE